MASRRSPKPPPAEIFLQRPERAHRPVPHHEGPVVKDFFVRRRRVLRRLRAKSSLIVLTSEILDAQHEATKKGDHLNDYSSSSDSQSSPSRSSSPSS